MALQQQQKVNPDPILQAVLFQVYYRQLGMVSIHIPIKDMIEAANRLKPQRGGTIQEIRKNMVYRWVDVEAFPNSNARMTVWMIGGSRNTAFIRVGWWKLYLVDSAVAKAMKQPPPKHFLPTRR